jgi:hypothetical protein
MITIDIPVTTYTPQAVMTLAELDQTVRDAIVSAYDRREREKHPTADPSLWDDECDDPDDDGLADMLMELDMGYDTIEISSEDAEPLDSRFVRYERYGGYNGQCRTWHICAISKDEFVRVFPDIPVAFDLLLIPPTF